MPTHPDASRPTRAHSARRVTWGFPTQGSVTSITLADEVVYVGGNDYTVRALRAADGTQLWSFTAEGPVESQIAVAGGIAYVGSNDGKVYALKRAG